MRLSFTVSGRTKAEIEGEAMEIVRGFAGQKVEAGIDFDVRPLAEQWGTTQPALWEAEVVADLADDV